MSIVTLNDRAVRSVTAFGSVSGGSMVFIKKLTASSSGTLSFVDGSSDVVLDNTYKEYLFTFKDIHPSAASTRFQFNGSTDGGSNYNVTKTTTIFIAGHIEADTDATLTYQSGDDLAQSTAFQDLAAYGDSDNANDSCLAGYLHIFNPSSTTFVKNFMSEFSLSNPNNYIQHNFVAGYFNTTSAIDEIQFKMSSGNIDAGDICLYGIN